MAMFMQLVHNVLKRQHNIKATLCNYFSLFLAKTLNSFKNICIFTARWG